MNSGKKSSISDEKIAQLEKLGFKYNDEKQLALDIAWNYHLSELIKFNKQWGHCDVP